jgi:hypothetical protein
MPLRFKFSSGGAPVVDVQVLATHWTRENSEEALTTHAAVNREKTGAFLFAAVPDLPVTVTARIVGREKTWTFRRPGKGGVAILDFADIDEDVRIDHE